MASFNFIQFIKSKIPQKLKFRLLCGYSIYLRHKYSEEFSKFAQRGFNSVPVFIISFNRLSYVKKMVEYLEGIGLLNIHIIDNASTYEPLLEYYKTLPYDIIYMPENMGHKVFWTSEIFTKYRKDFYVLTDPDVIPIENCPNDFMEVFFEALKKYPFLGKVGFSLKTDDIPDECEKKSEIVAWESQFSAIPVDNNNLYYAPIDTTFALYAPEQIVSKSGMFSRACRTAYPYQARHLPWYKNEKNITEEDIYYSSHAKNGWWNPVKDYVTPDDVEGYVAFERIWMNTIRQKCKKTGVK